LEKAIGVSFVTLAGTLIFFLPITAKGVRTEPSCGLSRPTLAADQLFLFCSRRRVISTHSFASNLSFKFKSILRINLYSTLPL
jgi:hypothetical protein